MIILNLNGVNSTIKRHTEAEWIQKKKKKKTKYMLPTRDALQLYTQDKSKGMEKDIPCK